ncbi:TatD family hydrolase [Spirochaeta dissipatitropha]
MYTDTHFHYLEMLKKGWTTDDIRTLFLNGDIRHAIEIGIHGHTDFPERKAALGDIPSIGFTIGFHPSQCGAVSPVDVSDLLEKHLTDPAVVAVGECGMDFHWDFGSTTDQSELFEAQVLLANKHSLPVIVHNRDATEQILELLQGTSPEAGGVMHCFESDRTIAAAFLDLGMHISFAGNLTFKRNNVLREVCAYIPSERLLLETDSPYLTPEPFRGKANSPGLIKHIYECAAAQRKTSVEEICDLVYRNSTKLFFKKTG